MRSDAHKPSRHQRHNLPQKTGFYLVAIHSKATSEHLSDYQVAHFDKASGRFQTDEYQPNEGTMEPRDITDIRVGWWNLPPKRARSRWKLRSFLSLVAGMGKLFGWKSRSHFTDSVTTVFLFTSDIPRFMQGGIYSMASGHKIYSSLKEDVRLFVSCGMVKRNRFLCLITNTMRMASFFQCAGGRIQRPD